MNIAWIVVALLLFGILIYACFKKKIVRFITLTILSVALPISAVYCGLQLNTYYNASGGIVGYLTGLYNPNAVEVVEDLEFKVTGVELVQSADSSSNYKAKVIINEVFEFDSEKEYSVTVNNAPCFDTTIVSDGLKTSYAYSFYNDTNDFLMTDTLTISVGFYDYYTLFVIQTNGGFKAVELWNAYWNTHDFIIKVDEGGFKENNVIDIVNGNTSNIKTHTVEFEVGDTVYLSKQFVHGEVIDIFDLPELIGVQKWQYVGLDNNIDFYSMSVKNDLYLRAVVNYSGLTEKTGYLGYYGSFYFDKTGYNNGLVYVDNNRYAFYSEGYNWDTYTYQEEGHYVIISSSSADVCGLLIFDTRTNYFTFVDTGVDYGWKGGYFSNLNDTATLTDSSGSVLMSLNCITGQYTLEENKMVGYEKV